MFYIADETLDRWIKEDIPYFDLTSRLLGMDRHKGRISYTTRDETVVCGTEEVSRIFSKLGIETTFMEPSGATSEEGCRILEGEGNAAALHAAWRVGLNVLEYACGIAGRTRRFVDNARSRNKAVEVVGTRKSFPGTKEMCIKAIVVGGALPHRLGLSETVLVFDQHRRFLGDDLTSVIARIKSRCLEKKIIVEADGVEDALTLVKAGIDGVQFDKVPEKALREYVSLLRAEKPGLVVLAAGGVNIENAAGYADTGINAIATSALYFGKPADIKAYLEEIK